MGKRQKVAKRAKKTEGERDGRKREEAEKYEKSRGAPLLEVSGGGGGGGGGKGGGGGEGSRRGERRDADT